MDYIYTDKKCSCLYQTTRRHVPEGCGADTFVITPNVPSVSLLTFLYVVVHTCIFLQCFVSDVCTCNCLQTEGSGLRVVTLSSRVIDSRRFGRTYRLHQRSSGPVTHPLGSVSVLRTLFQGKLHACAYVYEHCSDSRFMLQMSECGCLKHLILLYCSITVCVTTVSAYRDSQLSAHTRERMFCSFCTAFKSALLWTCTLSYSSSIGIVTNVQPALQFQTGTQLLRHSVQTGSGAQSAIVSMTTKGYFRLVKQTSS